MRRLLTLVFMSLSSPALAIQSGLYDLTFTPDDGTSSFTLCYYFANAGGIGSYEESGPAYALTPGPFGQPAGNYGIAEKSMMFDVINFAGQSGYIQYNFLLSAYLKDYRLDRIRHPRYVISTSISPAPYKPQAGASLAARPGDFNIVQTGAFSIVLRSNQHSCN